MKQGDRFLVPIVEGVSPHDYSKDFLRLLSISHLREILREKEGLQSSWNPLTVKKG